MWLTGSKKEAVINRGRGRHIAKVICFFFIFSVSASKHSVVTAFYILDIL